MVINTKKIDFFINNNDILHDILIYTKINQQLNLFH